MFFVLRRDVKGDGSSKNMWMLCPNKVTWTPFPSRQAAETHVEYLKAEFKRGKYGRNEYKPRYEYLIIEGEKNV